MRVLAAIDGSPGSFGALEQVACLLAPGKNQLALYYSPPSLSTDAASAGPDLIAKARMALAESVFDEAGKHVAADLRAGVHRIVGVQHARHGIVVAAEEWSADLIVVGARGLGRLERLLLGSVSRAVAHSSRIPVWIAREKSGTSGKVRRVLLACDSRETGRKTAELLAGFTWPPAATLQAMAVVESLFAGQVPDWLVEQAHSGEVDAVVQQWAREHDEDVAKARARVRESVESLRGRLQTLEPRVAEGQPAAEILKAISRDEIDLVVIGSRHGNPLAKSFLGSTSQAVLNHAACSVLVIPHHEAP